MRIDRDQVYEKYLIASRIFLPPPLIGDHNVLKCAMRRSYPSCSRTRDQEGQNAEPPPPNSYAGHLRCALSRNPNERCTTCCFCWPDSDNTVANNRWREPNCIRDDRQSIDHASSSGGPYRHFHNSLGRPNTGILAYPTRDTHVSWLLPRKFP
jgi:hypothetical protein